MYKNTKISTKEQFVEDYPVLVALAYNEISTQGYSYFFIEWFDIRVKNTEIISSAEAGFQFSEEYENQILKSLEKYE